MILVMILGLGAGLLLGFALDVTYPSEFSFYITMGLLAAMDSLLGAVRSYIEGKYSNPIFISGFLANAILAAVLVYMGDRLGVPLYYAVIFVFGGRLFQNLAVIRRIILDKYFLKNRQDNLKK